MANLDDFIKKFPSLTEGKILDDEKMGKLEGGGPCESGAKKVIAVCKPGPAIVITPTTKPPKEPTLPPIIKTM